MKDVIIRSGTIDEVILLTSKIQEFVDPYGKEEYDKRLYNKKKLILIALADATPVGFKVGYEKEQDGSFYSWMGGVLSAFRQRGIARLLAMEQERFAKANGYSRIKMKTRNCHKPMLLFSISNNFKIIEIEKKRNIDDYRICLEKFL